MSGFLTGSRLRISTASCSSCPSFWCSVFVGKHIVIDVNIKWKYLAHLESLQQGLCVLLLSRLKQLLGKVELDLPNLTHGGGRSERPEQRMPMTCGMSDALLGPAHLYLVREKEKQNHTRNEEEMNLGQVMSNRVTHDNYYRRVAAMLTSHVTAPLVRDRARRLQCSQPLTLTLC